MFFTMAIRMAQDMNIYKDSDATSPEIADLPIRIQKEFRRRIWWICYQIDKLSASRTPFSMMERETTIPLPAPEEIWNATTAELETFDGDAHTEIAIMASSESFCAGLTLESPFGSFIILVCLL